LAISIIHSYLSEIIVIYLLIAGTIKGGPLERTYPRFWVAGFGSLFVAGAVGFECLLAND
jgi:hypothetical protein